MLATLSVATGVALLSTLCVGAPTEIGKRAAPLKFSYGGTKVRGVNLGGWLVTEPWITPNLYQDWADGNSVKDEYTMCQTLGKDAAQAKLTQHWDTWITEDDIKQIASYGLNHVRIPIGYWSILPINGEPYVQGAYSYLEKALGWAQAAGLKVLIDLHGAQGSQNGFDNSGRLGNIAWTQGDSVSHTLNVLKKIRDDFASHPAVSAIQLLNEPMGPKLNMDTVRQFYMDGWGSLKDSSVAIVFHDAFQGVTSWNGFGDGMWSLMVDTHHYEIFDGQIGLNPNDHIGAACAFGSQMASNNKWTIAGEWTGAITDCAKWLNGLGKGARYDGTFEGHAKIGSCDGKYTGSVAALSNDDKYNIQRFIEAQLDAYEKAAGWIFWTWKTESAPEWNMKQLLEAGLFPNPITTRKFPHQCG